MGGKSKHYVLIRDENLKSYIGFKSSEILEMEWTPKCRYVKLVMNDEYKGLYLLCEQVKVEENRVQVDEDGYFFECDAYWWNEDFYLESSLIKELKYTFKYPDIPSEEDSLYMSSLINEMESSLKETNEYELIDEPSFAKWVLAQDLMGNDDWAGSNMYFRIRSKATPVITMPVLWDYNQILQVQYGWAPIHKDLWFKYLFMNDTFWTVYKQLWDQYSEKFFEGIEQAIVDFSNSEFADAFDELVQIDNDKYGKSYKTISEYVDEYKETLRIRKMSLSNSVLVTAIQTGNLFKDEKDKSWYSVQGYNVTSPQKGLYLKKGKKYLFK